FLTGVVAMILGVSCAGILMDYTGAALGPASFSSGPWWEL
ncbi:putative membrane protein, partial [Rhodococcus opacus M213]